MKPLYLVDGYVWSTVYNDDYPAECATPVGPIWGRIANGEKDIIERWVKDPTDNAHQTCLLELRLLGIELR
jgi:hypothetical protein